MQTIVEIIQALRDPPFRLSQTEISRQTGIHQAKLSRWFSGRIPAGADDALKLQALLNTDQLPNINVQAATESVAAGGVDGHAADHGNPPTAGVAVCQPGQQGV